MPVFEFRCKNGCGKFEAIRKHEEVSEVRCPACKGEAEKIFSPFSWSFGWRLTDESNHIKGYKDKLEPNI